MRALAWELRRFAPAFGALLVIGVTTGAAVTWTKRVLLPAPHAIARGVRVGGEVAPAGASPHEVAEACKRRILERRVELRYDGRTLIDAAMGELGAEVDVEALEETLARIGHESSLTARIDSALEARRGHIDVPVRFHLPVELLAERISRFKEEIDRAPTPAKFSFAAHTASAEAAGTYIDAYRAAELVERAAKRGDQRIDLEPFAMPPMATAELVAHIDTTHALGSYETRFGYLWGQEGRAQNVSHAASLIDGVVLMPNETVSFNANVGPRTEENGFAPAPEIYKGEMREGVGGGTCQVAGTLYAAAFFAGIDIVERSNHSRPSSYLKLGLDATVVYPVVDLRLRNPFDFPIVVHAQADRGKLRIEFLGREERAKVDMSVATLSITPFKRKIELAPWFKPGEFRIKQKGIKGYSIRKTRRIHLTDGTEKTEVTVDVYPPTFEVYRVAPGIDVATALPPLADSQTSG